MMRIPGILLALPFVFASVWASAASNPFHAAPSSVASSVKSDLRTYAAEASPIDESHPGNQRLRYLHLRSLGSSYIEEDRDRVCYTMRSYMVARESRDSDSTELVGYSTCQPSSKYELRITLGEPKE